MKNIFRISVIVILTLAHALTVFSPTGCWLGARSSIDLP